MNNMPFLYQFNMLEERIFNLEKEVNFLKNRIEKLENNKKDNYSNNYQPNMYQMM